MTPPDDGRLAARSVFNIVLRSGWSLQIFHQPVADEVDAELPIIDLTMFGTAFGFGEDSQCFVFRTYPLVEFLRLCERHDAIVFAVQDQDRGRGTPTLSPPPLVASCLSSLF